MKRRGLPILLLCSLAFLSGCRSTEKDAGQSTFKATFSIASMVDANQHYLLPGPRVSAGSEAGPTEPFTQTSEMMTVQVNAANVAVFLEAIQAGIQESLINSGASVLGGGGSASGGPAGALPEPTHFWFSYRQGGIEGAIHVWGVPSTGTNLVLIITIVES